MKQRKAYVGVLVVAVGALVVDRALLGPGDELGTQSAPGAVEAPPTPVAVEEPSPPTLAAEVLLDDVRVRLERVAFEGEAGRDAFDHDPFDLGALGAGETTGGPTMPGASENARDRFTSSFRLTLVATGHVGLASSGSSDTRIVRVGQEVGGFTLERIEGRSAIFVSGSSRVTLFLDPNAAPESGDRAHVPNPA